LTWFGRRGGDYDPPMKKPVKEPVASAVILPFPVKRQPEDEDREAFEIFKKIMGELHPGETMVVYIVNEDDEPV
jgi:hypothetical protein